LFSIDFQGPCIHEPSIPGQNPELVAIPPEHLDNLRGLRDGKHAGATEFPLPLAGEPNLQVARAGTAVFHLAPGGDPKTLLDAFVCLLLWHGWGFLEWSLLSGRCGGEMLLWWLKNREVGECAAAGLGEYRGLVRWSGAVV
jgi:hypothetical protein